MPRGEAGRPIAEWVASLQRPVSWSSAMSELQSVNRRLANLLTTARLYVHQTERGLARLFGRRSPQLITFRTAVEEQVRNSLGHRVMHALRNHLQHSNLPIHSLTYDSGWKDEKEGRFLVFVTVPKIQVSRLQDDRDLRSIAEELRALGDLIDVRPLVRQHVQSVMTVHVRVRELVAAEEANCLSVVEGALTRGEEAFQGDAVSLGLVEQDRRGALIQRFEIFREPIERLRYLRRKNPCFANLPLHYVSGKASPGERSG